MNRWWMAASFWIRAAIVVSIIMGVITVIALLGPRVNSQLRALNTASTDNLQWTYSQIEVEFLVFQREVDIASAALTQGVSPDLNELRQRFDIFYSRAASVRSRQQSPEALSDIERNELLSQVVAFLDTTVVYIDGTDTALVAYLPQLQTVLPETRHLIRQFALRNVFLQADTSQESRDAFSWLLGRTALVASSLIIILGIALVLLGIQARQTRLRGLESERIRRRMSAAIEASLDAILVADDDGRIVDLNSAAEALFKLPRHRALGALLASFFQRDLKSNFENQHLGRFETVARRAGGAQFPAEVSQGIAQAERGRFSIAYVRDISERKEAEALILKARDEAQMAERAKSRFLAVMSHEMRTPLNGLIGMLDLMGRGQMTDKQSEYLEVAKGTSEVLLHHMNDVLDISKIEAGTVALEQEVFDPSELIRQVIAGFKGSARANGNQLTVKTNGHLGLVAGDRHRMRQILSNLVGNALKFTENGDVTVEVERQDADNVNIDVMDTGIGIAAENLSKVFEDFVTLDGNYDRAAEGTGLGLGIARRIARAMGGDINVRSVLGHGSTFSVILPLPRESEMTSIPQIESEPTPDIELPPLKILVVEDNEINRMVLEEILATNGHDVSYALDGLEGVAMANSILYDVILMDISMPRLDGVEATIRIRAENGASSHVPIIALTAHAQAEEQARFLSAGMSAALVKPVRRHALFSTLLAVSTGTMITPVQRQIPVAEAKPYLQKLRVDTDVLSDMLEMLGEDKFQMSLGKFLNETDADLEKILTSDPEMTKSGAERAAIAHRIRGSAGVFGAEALRATLADYENGSLKADMPKVQGASKVLPEIWARTRAELGEYLAQEEDTDADAVVENN